MTKKDELLYCLLDCKYLDLEFMLNLYKKYNISFYDICINKKYLDINLLINKILNIIAKKFINKYRLNKEVIYIIYTEWVASYIEFENIKIQELFENSEFAL